jgi:hypothetical protein
MASEQKTMKRIEFQMRIKGAGIAVPNDTDVYVLWVRGPKKTDTKVVPVNHNRVTINDKFEMKTQIDID